MPDDQPISKAPDKKDPTKEMSPDEKVAYRGAVKLKTERIKSAKKKFEPDFKRMRENSGFAYGFQSDTQDKLHCLSYRANFITREVNNKVASLYARDPKAIYRRRKRMDFQFWDGDPVSKMAAQQAAQQAAMMGMPPDPQAQALLDDISQGEAWQKIVERVGHTMEYLYQYECDTQAPDFKYQMKQLVRRTVTTGVGFVRLHFSRLGESAVTSSGTDDSVSTRVKRAKYLAEQLEKEKIEKDDPRVLEIQSLMQSVLSSVHQGDMQNVEERLEFDFPNSTSIIVDPRCKSLKGFVGARWIAQQYIVPLDFVNSYFGVDISSKGDGAAVIYREDGETKDDNANQPTSPDVQNDPTYKPLVCLWELFDLDTKSVCWLVDGYKDYVSEPEAVDPIISRFWPIFCLTFNDVEVEHGSKATIYPPSDVDLLWHAQREWNATREALAEHRRQNAPFYITKAGWLTDGSGEDASDNDIAKLNAHQSGEVVQIQGIPPDGDIAKSLVAFKPAPLDPNLYNTQPLQEDATLVVGSDQPQEPPHGKTAATPAVIAEQKRISSVNSNVDDLDDLQSELARAAGEVMLREFSETTVKRIAGRGATLGPEQMREDFLNEIFLDIVASSSGRPNKAVEIANFERLAPLMLQAGANPWAVIEEATKRLDDRIDASKFAPSEPPSQTPAAKPKSPHAGPHGAPAQGGQPLHPNPGQMPVPMPSGPTAPGA